MKSLKSLQDEWRKLGEVIEAGWSGQANEYSRCADALTPFVEREAKDMELIEMLLSYGMKYKLGEMYPSLMKAAHRRIENKY